MLASTILVIGIKESAKVNNLIVVLKLAVVLLFIIFGLQYVNPDNWKPFIPPNTGDSGNSGGPGSSGEPDWYSLPISASMP